MTTMTRTLRIAATSALLLLASAAVSSSSSASSRLLREQSTEAAMHMGSGDESALAQSTPLKLALTGMFFGLIHVLTGPDHLSALATLSAGSSWRSFALGIRWGCGHSIGLVIMAVVFISLDGELDFTVLNVVTDVLVGVFMVALGLYGVHEGIKKSKASSKQRRLEREVKRARLAVAQHDSDSDDTSSASKDVSDSDARRLSDGDELSPGQASKAPMLSPSTRRQRLHDIKRRASVDSGSDSDSDSNDTSAETATVESESSSIVVFSSNGASPSESTVAQQQLLSSRSAVSTDSDLDTDASASRDAEDDYATPKLCGAKCPRIDFKNAQTQKVRACRTSLAPVVFTWTHTLT